MQPPERQHFNPLVALDHARIALEHADSVIEVREIRDRAEALRTYAKTAGMGLEAQNRCAELRLRAEHKAGRILGATVTRGGDRRPGARSHDATLAELGISRSQSSRWQQVGALTESDLDTYLADCVESSREITTRGLLSVGRPGNRKVETSSLPAGGFRTILADPPWPYRNGGSRGAARNHYPAMSVEDLCALPVTDAAAEAAHLYLWATNSFLREAFDVMAAWGFEYKTLLTWTKPQLGIGNYFRGATEHILFGVRGGLPTLRSDLPTWFSAPRDRHSTKPDISYDLIESASPGRRLELFARQSRPGWDAWGDEIEESHEA